jgi:hypothetical protein
LRVLRRQRVYADGLRATVDSRVLASALAIAVCLGLAQLGTTSGSSRQDHDSGD